MIHRRPQGFTLVELLTVVTVIAILAGVAIPSYRQYIHRSNRAGAKTALLENAQFLERNRTTSNRYDLDGAGNPVDSDSLLVKQSPQDGRAQYTIAFAANPTRTAFTLVATPVSGGPMAGDQCGSFTLNDQGKKGLTGATAAVSECWNK